MVNWVTFCLDRRLSLRYLVFDLRLSWDMDMKQLAFVLVEYLNISLGC